MATLLDRRLPRAEFRAPVLMTLPGADTQIAAQALNLSERGLFVGTEERPEVGSLVRLSLPIGADDLDVGGRIAWTRNIAQAGAPAGVGIEFTDLDHAGLEQIKAAIGSDREHAIRVRFPGLPAPIRARAAVRDGTLSLHAELPFLRLGSVADFALEGDASSHRGRIRRVAVEPGSSSDTPRLRIEVEVLGLGGLGGRVITTAANDEIDTTPNRAPHLEGPRPEQSAETAETGTETLEPAPEVSAAAERAAIEIPIAAPQWIEPTAELSTERIARRGRITRLPALVCGAAAVMAFSITYLALGLGVNHSIAGPRIDLAGLEDVPAGGALATAAEPPRVAPARGSAPRPLTVERDGHTTKVHLAITGTADGLRHYLLADPAGVAVQLPSGTFNAATKVHWTETGLAKKIWIRSTDSGDQARIFFDGNVSEYTLETSDSVLTIELR